MPTAHRIMTPHVISQQQPRSRRNEIVSFFHHQNLFHDIGSNNRPEADIRFRFYDVRAIRAQHFELPVFEARAAYYGFMNEVRQGKINLDSEWTGERFDKIMHDLDQGLTKLSMYLRYLPYP